MIKIGMTLVVAAIGGLIGLKLRLPAGGMIGAMFAVGLYNLSGAAGAIMPLDLPAHSKLVVQILAGAVIGMSINRELLIGMREMWFPALINTVTLLGLGLVVGLVLHKTAGMDLVTAMFGSAPGGLNEMTLAGEAMGGEGAKIVLLQTIRLVGVITVMPWVIRWALGWLEKG